jgi:hypothetical protein
MLNFGQTQFSDFSLTQLPTVCWLRWEEVFSHIDKAGNRSLRIGNRILVVLGVVVATTSGASADSIVQYTGVGSGARSLFPADDLLDWGQLGPQCSYPGAGCVPNGSLATSNGGIGITIFSPNGSFDRLDEGSEWTGHFQAGDHLIWDDQGPGTVAWPLQRDVAGIGFEIRPTLAASSPRPSMSLTMPTTCCLL